MDFYLNDIMMKRLDCKVNDENIYGVVYIPDTNKDKYPTIIFCHGFCVTHTYFNDYVDKLIKHDIACYLFDFRGGLDNNKSSRNLLNTSVLTENEDLKHVVEMIRSMDFVDFNQLYLLGHSQGGFDVALIASQYPNMFKNIFLLAPGFLIPEEMNNTLIPGSDELCDIGVGIISRRYVLDARKINIYNKIGVYDKRVYIFHGANDTAVPIEYSRKAVNIYSNAELIIIPNQKHNFKDDAKKIVLEKILNVVNGG